MDDDGVKGMGIVGTHNKPVSYASFAHRGHCEKWIN